MTDHSWLRAVAVLALTLTSLGAHAIRSGATVGSTALADASTAGSGSSGTPAVPNTTGTVDGFTGTFNQDIPIEIVPGRHGVQPRISLHYRSTGTNSPLGIGWELELGGIERRTKGGLVYSGPEQKFVLRSTGSAADLVAVGSEYRLQVEGAFLRIRQLTAADGQIYWEVTDRAGTRSTYGKTPVSRQDDPNQPARIFRWCLDSVEDVHGNTISYTYTKTGGRTYPQQIDYTGHSSGAFTPTNRIAFGWEARGDTDPDYLPGFAEQFSSRLSTIDVTASGQLVRRYKLNYYTSGTTKRSLLASIAQYGKDGTTALPPLSFDWSAPSNGTMAGLAIYQKYAAWSTAPYGVHVADVNGDGYDDVVVGPDSAGTWFVMKGTASGLADQGTWMSNVFPHADANAQLNVRTGDFDGDGKQDIIIGPSIDLLTNAPLAWAVLKSNASGTGFVYVAASPYKYGEWTAHPQRVRAFDVNGDGKTDILIGPDAAGSWYLLQSDGTQFIDRGTYITSRYGNWDGDDTQSRVNVADVTGDGLPDIVLGPDFNGAFYVLANTGAGFEDRQTWFNFGGAFLDGIRTIPMDVNGDGKVDIVSGPWPDGRWTVLMSTGSSFAFVNAGTGYAGMDPNHVHGVDVNGDGRGDLVIGPDSMGYMFAMESTGSSFVDKGVWQDRSTTASWDELMNHGSVRWLDMNGDGRADLLLGPDATGNWWVSKGIQQPDVVVGVRNGYGGQTRVSYQPSTRFTNRQLPFAVPVVTSVSTDDGNGVVGTTDYSYGDGYFHTAEKDFRGFGTATVMGPAWPNGARTSTTTWYHQGNDVGVAVNDPSGRIGYMKGKPYSVSSGDTASTSFWQTDTTYQTPTGTANGPFFTPPADVLSRFCTGASSCAQTTRTAYTYDIYGNATLEYRYGDVTTADDDRTIVRDVVTNSGAWILGIVCSERTYTGVDVPTPLATSQIARTDFHYDDQTGCSPSSPRGDATWVSRWLNGGSSPVSTTTYDSYGNVIVRRDPNGSPTTFTYDSSKTFVIATTNAAQHTSTTAFYGVDGVAWSAAATDPGVFGLPKSTSDPNSATTTLGYDVFGRPVSQVDPDGFTTSREYRSLGSVGIQNVLVSSPRGISESYFDGLGRTIHVRHQGTSSGRWITSETEFLGTGATAQTSSARFESNTTALWTTFEYDVHGRPVRTTNPDGAVVRACYDDMVGVSVGIDPNGHRRRETRDVQGRTIRIEEYKGAFDSCTTGVGTPYATTRFEYPPLETRVFNAVDAPLVTAYDTLGRRISMSDPDLGNWSYAYDAAGNLKLQTTAGGGAILFDYDPIGRVMRKHPCAGAYPSLATCQAETASALVDVTMEYDTTGIAFSKGRLIKITDPSGSTAFTYNVIGQQVAKSQTIKYPVTDVVFDTKAEFDNARRLKSITYPKPDLTKVSYSYDADGNLSDVRDGTTVYATLSGYNEASQVAGVTMGDTSVLSYTYDPKTRRVARLAAVKGGTALLDLNYSYDRVGNITAIEDRATPNDSEHFRYDELNRLTWAESRGYTPNNVVPPAGLVYHYDDPQRVHVLTSTSDGRAFTYDPNGNTKTDGIRTFTWDQENRAATVTTSGIVTTFTYDGTGARVKKAQQGGGTVVYGGKLFECTNAPGCTHWTRYIFAGSMRIAQVTAGSPPVYYATDHLGSTRVVTGSPVGSASYQPFGPTNSDTLGVRYKFTGQEADSETRLDNYGARLYDPVLGRFLSADSLIGGSENPQALNRYSYANNNPVLYKDPSGHLAIVDDMFVGAVIGGLVGGTLAAVTGQNVFRGIGTGAMMGAFMGFGGGVVSAAGVSSSGLQNAAILAGSGAAGGAATAALNGGHIAEGAVAGGAMALLGYGVGPTNYQFIGCVASAGCDGAPVAGALNFAANSALRGAGFGAIDAALSHRNILDGAVSGAKAWALGAGLNMFVGHVVGITATGRLPTYDENTGAFVYEGPLTWAGTKMGFGNGAVTLGNVVTAGPDILGQQNRREWGTTIGDHEVAGHMNTQGTVFTPSYIPAHILALAIGSMLGDHHAYNVLERGFIDVPYW